MFASLNLSSFATTFQVRSKTALISASPFNIVMGLTRSDMTAVQLAEANVPGRVVPIYFARNPSRTLRKAAKAVSFWSTATNPVMRMERALENLIH